MLDTLAVVVESLYIYPVKACAPMPVAQIDFNDSGRLMGDREWAVIDDQGCVTWQGSHPRLALVRPTTIKGALQLKSTTSDWLDVQNAPDQHACQVHIWDDTDKKNLTFAATDAGDAAAAFLTHTVGAPLRLVRLGEAAMLRSGVNRLHVVSSASQAELCAELAAAHVAPASIERLRPNMVITGAQEALPPFIEDHFTQLEWPHDAPSWCMSMDALCVRCIVPNVDPATGTADALMLETLVRMSAARHPGKPVCFGIYVRASGSASLARGTVLRARVGF